MPYESTSLALKKAEGRFSRDEIGQTVEKISYDILDNFARYHFTLIDKESLARKYGVSE